MAYSEDWPCFKDLLKAHHECRVGKPASFQQTRFETRLGENLLKLEREIHARKYKPSQSSVFVVTNPKPREVFAAHFRDRVVHHLIVSRLSPVWEKKFSPLSFACRKGKGTHGAIKEIQRQVRRISQGGHHTVYALQLDIASFFVSIHRPTLKNLFLKSVNPKEKTLIWLINAFMDHDPRIKAYIQSPPHLQKLILPKKSWFNQGRDTGLPIGNLTSQFGANVYLNELDQWITRDLKPQGYLRYMDDLTLLDRDPEKLKNWINPIDHWLRTHRHQDLNHSKTSLKSLVDGIEYLGYRLQQKGDPKNPLSLFITKKKKWDFVKDIRHLGITKLPPPTRLHPLAPTLNYKNARTRLQSINARLGQFKHARCYQLKKKNLTRLNDVLSEVDLCFDQNREIKRVFSPIKIKKNLLSIKLK